MRDARVILDTARGLPQQEGGRARPAGVPGASATPATRPGASPGTPTVRQHCRGYCALIRYADDALVVFEHGQDAQRFMRVLPKRLGKCGVCLNHEKTRLLACGKQLTWQAFREGTPWRPTR